MHLPRRLVHVAVEAQDGNVGHLSRHHRRRHVEEPLHEIDALRRVVHVDAKPAVDALDYGQVCAQHRVGFGVGVVRVSAVRLVLGARRRQPLEAVQTPDRALPIARGVEDPARILRARMPFAPFHTPVSTKSPGTGPLITFSSSSATFHIAPTPPMDTACLARSVRPRNHWTAGPRTMCT